MKEEKNSVPLSFWEHLDVLRGYLMKMAIAVAALFVVAFLFKDALFDIVLAPKNNDFITYQLFRSVAGRLGLGTMENFSVDLINTGLADQFLIHIRVAFFVALLCASPFLLYLLFRFISPALYEREKLYVLKVMPGAYLMFILGVSLCYFIIFPFTFRFLGTYQVSSEVENLISLQSYISTLTMMSLLMGLLFELPILCWLLAKAGIISYGLMKGFRRHAVIVILIVAAVITPTSDVFTLSLVSIPIYLLYETSILIVKRVEKYSLSNK